MKRYLPAMSVLLFLVAAADWALLKFSRVSHPTWVLGALVGATLLLIVAASVAAVADLASGRRPRGRRIAGILVGIGSLVALGGGSANWLLSLQGYTILHEGEVVPLYGGSHLQVFASGPLADPHEIHLSLGLEEVEIVAATGDFFFPRSRLVAVPQDGSRVAMTVDRHNVGKSGSLRFYQGAFGFAPRIVIIGGEETLLDRVVPFMTRREGPAGIAFEQRFTVERDDLEIDGRIDLATLDEGLRGHATLELTVVRSGELLGRGSLSPGHFAEIGEGYRVGFAGLKKWSEIDVSRRNYQQVVLFGAAMALLGAVAWLVTRWVAW